MSITSANSVLTLTVPGLFDTPITLQGFASDDAFSMDDVENKEVVMGVDGIMSSGWIPQIKMMHIALQADSLSNDFFETWYGAEEQHREVYAANGVVTQPGVNRVYTLTNGCLSGYSPMAGNKKTLEARKFGIKWNVVLAVPQ